jgi:hypothetical protein
MVPRPTREKKVERRVRETRFGGIPAFIAMFAVWLPRGALI